MKILAYIIFGLFLLIVIFWFTLPYIINFILRYIQKRMQQSSNETTEKEGDTIISSKKSSDAQTTEFEELN